jgi:hypothetical protein
MVEDYQGKEGNTDLYRWVRKNARISQATKDDIVAINQSSGLSKRQWISLLDQRSQAGDVYAISLRLKDSTASIRWGNCDVCSAAMQFGRYQMKDDTVICKTCWNRIPKFCCLCRKTKPGAFRQEKRTHGCKDGDTSGETNGETDGDTNGKTDGDADERWVCPLCQKEDFSCLRCRKDVFEVPVGKQGFCLACRREQKRK